VAESVANRSVNDPLLFDIETDPPAVTALLGEAKSALATDPETATMVQYRVPEPNAVVVIL
jgi:hypothetical protein